MSSPLSTKEILSSNLRALIDLHEWSERALAEKSKVAQKTINKILNQQSSPTAEITEKLAKAFGLNGWQLMFPDLPTDLFVGAEDIAARIRQARETKGWSQHQLAKKVGMSQEAISKIEVGQVRQPRQLHRLAKTLEISVLSLIGEHESQSLQVLFENYISASGAGREYINRVAAKEAEYRRRRCADVPE